jgi:hypothetical protein
MQVRHVCGPEGNIRSRAAAARRAGAAGCVARLTIYMVGSAAGMVAGGSLASNAERCEYVVGFGVGVAALIALALGFAALSPFAVPPVFGAMDFCAGLAGLSHDLLVTRSAPEGATGRVYGVVYSGLDIGQATAPLLFGNLMDLNRPAAVRLGMVVGRARTADRQRVQRAARRPDGTRAGLRALRTRWSARRIPANMD